MATPKQNYAKQYQAYAQSIEPDIPSSVRTYSIFNPDTGAWQRMTNGFRSPIPVQGQTLIPTQTPGIMLRPRTQVPPMTPAQEQAAINLALAQARATQGKDYIPRQTPAQTPSRGSRMPQNGQKKGGMGVSLSPASGVPQRASQGQIPAFLQAAVNREGYRQNLLSSDFANGQRTPQEAILLESATPRTAQPYQGFGYLMPQMPVYEVETLPAAQIPVVSKQSTVPSDTSMNVNKEKPFGLKSSSEIQAELEAEEKADMQADVRKYRRVTKALNEGTYSSIKELLGLYGWAAEHNRNFIPELPDFDY